MEPQTSPFVYACMACYYSPGPVFAMRCVSCKAKGTLAPVMPEWAAEMREKRGIFSREEEPSEEDDFDDDFDPEEEPIQEPIPIPLAHRPKVSRRVLKPLSDIVAGEVERIATGVRGLDRVLGGGFVLEKKGHTVTGTSVLFWGPAGSGKTTLALTSLSAPASRGLRCMYASLEEPAHRTKRRANELGLCLDILPLEEVDDIDEVLDIAARHCIDILAIDSAQMFRSTNVDGQPGGERMLKYFGERVKSFTQSHSTIVVVLSQVSKSGSHLGTNALAHVVDVNLQLAKVSKIKRRLSCEGKNRFSTGARVWRCEIDQDDFGRVVDRKTPAPDEKKTKKPFERKFVSKRR